MGNQKELKCDVVVIGSGMSGMSAALFAAREGLSVIQISHHSPLVNHSGTIDIMSCAPLQGKKIWKNPLRGIGYLCRENNDHPYAKLDLEEIKMSLGEVKKALAQQGLDYRGSTSENHRVLTSLGTLKPTCLVPATMWAGEKALARNTSGLIVDIAGLRGFSAREIVETVKAKWSNLRASRIEFPGLEAKREAVPELMARALENPVTLKEFAERIKSLINDEGVVGIPAVLGVNHSRRVHNELKRMLGVPVFEIPSMPASVPGIRLNEVFDTILRKEGVTRYGNRRVTSVVPLQNQRFQTGFTNDDETVTINSASLVIASGRFTGRGLIVNGEDIREPLLNLPVQQPELKTEWYRTLFFNRTGHGINRAGIFTDRFFRPVDIYPQAIYPNLFTVGAINACQDWVREKSGSGLAVASAYKAVQGITKYCRINGNSTRRKPA